MNVDKAKSIASTAANDRASGEFALYSADVIAWRWWRDRTEIDDVCELTKEEAQAFQILRKALKDDSEKKTAD